MRSEQLGHTSSLFETSHQLSAEMWTGLGGQSNIVDRIAFVGEGELSSPFSVAGLAAASFAVCGAAVAELCSAAELPTPLTRVDRRQAAVWFDFPLAPSRPLGASGQHGIHSKWMAEFPTADNRWLRVQATYPTLRARMVTALGCADDIDAIARAVAGLPGEIAEERLIAAGAAAALARSQSEWLQHPAGRAVATEPLAAVVTTEQAPDRWQPTAERPLLGIRVLDLTRVVAGPMATRFLAALGAEVLRIDHPDGDEFLVWGVNDLGLGKRWATLDYKTDHGTRVLRKLIASADVLITSHRADALERIGLGAEERATLRPGLVDVAMNAYGWVGPWRNRRGFDTLVQYATGIAHSVSQWANEDPVARLPLNALGHLVDASRPRHLPVEALDFSTGYQVAAAAILGLARRVREGSGSITRLSLARTAHMLAGTATPDGPIFALPWASERLHPGVFDMNGRAVRRLTPPISMEGIPLRWDRPAERPGSSAPCWSTDRTGDQS
ncbi:CoA transferase [Nocardia aurea]|uniref:CoA transferase n=1 Tax=Nocardia aurea TaxID=2144174 RepID=UPI000D685CEE|nr:CoA transferase [Nocardia aurea]